MHPAVIESAILGLMGVTGVGLAWLIGFRRVVPLAIVGIATSISLRVLISIALWGFGVSRMHFEIWIGASVLFGSIGLALGRRSWKRTIGATVALGLGSVLAVATKYLLDIGEKEHSDSAAIIASALLAVQPGEMGAGQIGSILGVKRGPAYPLLLSLGPDQRLFGAVTPLIFLVTLIALVWAIRELIPHSTPPWVFGAVGMAIGAFSLSVPIFRASMFYLNSHTLMGLGLLLMTIGYLVTQRDQRFGANALWLTVLGGIIASTARSEGVALAAVVLAALSSLPVWDTIQRRAMLGIALTATGGTFAWWVIALDSPIADRVPGQPWTMFLLVVALVLFGASPLIDPVRPHLLLTVGVMLAGYLGWVIASSASPQSLLFAQWPNLVGGAGGWGLAAPAAVTSIVLLGWRGQPASYRSLVVIASLVIGAIFATKTLDSGFGRASFFDSVNRMYLHVMPVVLLATALGYISLLSRAFARHPQRDNIKGTTRD